MIIDFHCHLGNILYENGGNIIRKKGIRRLHPFDPDAISRMFAYNNKWVSSMIDHSYISKFVSMAERNRNQMASAENLLYYMDKHDIAKSVIMPIAPNVPYDAVHEVCKDMDRFIVFGSVDFTRDDIEQQVTSQINHGAIGFKIHPILQKTSAIDEKMNRMMRACPDNTIILSHTGYSNYYSRKNQDKQSIEFGDIKSFQELCKSYPDLLFVAGHAGLREINEVMELLAPLDNVWVDTSFQSPDDIVMLIDHFGVDRILYASDWPYGFHNATIRAVKKAVPNVENADKIFYKNAKFLLGIE